MRVMVLLAAFIGAAPALMQQPTVQPLPVREAAAVHAGVLGVGDFAFLKVTLLPGQGRYDGSARYGVTSQPVLRPV